MRQGWERLTFLHWPVPPERMRPLIPSQLEIDEFEGSAWLGLVPFEVTGLPYLLRFPETNLRTYVRGPAGERGIWFFTLEAARLAAVFGARLTYALPYHWAKMSVVQASDAIRYRSRRRFAGVYSDLKVRPGSPIRAGDREVFLTARFRLYTMRAGRLYYAQVEHSPWPLHSAELLSIDQNITEAYNLPTEGEPLVHYSPALRTRIGFLRAA